MLTRPGLLSNAQDNWQTGDVRLLLLNGTFDPISSLGGQILPTEVASSRPLVSIDTLAWNSGTNAVDIAVSASFTPTETVPVTRLALIGTDSTGSPNEFGNLPTVAKAAGTFSIALATTHDVTVGQLVYFADGTSATVDSIAATGTTDFTYTMTAGDTDPATSANVFPARGRLLGSYEPLSPGTIINGAPITISVSGSDTTA